MSTKYSKEDITDITKPFIQDCLDADFIQDKMYERTNFSHPEKINLFTRKENSDHGIIDKQALIKFGEQILNNNLYASINAYNMILPSVNAAGCFHAVALMTDCKAKTIWYQDSYGTEMRQEIKDFLKQILPNYKITSFTQIQQDKKRNDQSCYLLAEYNLLDMWFRKSNQIDKIKSYTSDEARQAVWNIVQQIEASPKKEAKILKRNKTPQHEVLSKKYLLECQKNTYKDFKYNLTQEKNYKEIIKQAAHTATSKHLLYKQGLIDLNLISK